MGADRLAVLAGPSTYQGEPGAPRDPATPGGYCLARCYCGSCQQFGAQRAFAALLREQEFNGRLSRDAEHAARRDRRGRRPRPPAPDLRVSA